MTSDHDKILRSLSRLSKYLDQLKQWPELEDVDIRSLATAIGSHVEMLEQLLPPGALRARLSPGDSPGRQASGVDWIGELERLSSVNRQCLEKMVRLRDKTAAELNGLRQHRKMINAYGRLTRSR